MKGLILSGGKGTRLFPLTYTNAKQLIPVANKPVLIRVIEAIRDAGVDDIGIVIGDTGPVIRAEIGDGSRWNVNITYIPQDQPKGLAHAVKISRDFLGDQRFVMFLGDNVLQGGISPLLKKFATSDYNAQIVLTHVKEPQHYGVAEIEDGHIKRLIEKPKEPLSNLALVGIYMFDHHIFDAVEAIKPSWRGELEITDAIQYMVEQNYVVHPYIHKGWWIDTGKPIDMLAANSLVLQELEPSIEGTVDSDSEIEGQVIIESGAEIINSRLRGPLIIGKDTRIVNSYVGPFTSIYHDCLLQNSEIAHCIVLEHTRIMDIPVRIEDSLIGRNVEVTLSPGKPRVLRLTLGDHSKVGIL